MSSGNASENALTGRFPDASAARSCDRAADARATLFVEKGYDATTMTEIAAQAGASIGSLYLFFFAKASLAQTLLATLAEALSARLDALQARVAGSAPAAIGDALFAELSRFLDEHLVYSVLIELRGDNAWRDSVRARRRGQIVALFAAASPKLPEGMAERLAMIVPELMRINMELRGLPAARCANPWCWNCAPCSTTICSGRSRGQPTAAVLGNTRNATNGVRELTQRRDHMHLRIQCLVLLLVAFSITVAQAAEPIRIGVLTDLSSFGANVTGTGSVAAAKLAVEDFGGQIGERPIVIQSADTQNKPDIATALASEWFDVDHVDVIVDVPQSAVALGVQDIARARKKLLLITSAVTQDLTGKACSPFTIHWADDTYALATGTAREVVASGNKSWFFITADFAFGTAMQAALTRVVEQFGGSVVGTVRPPTNTDDFSAYLLTAQASKAKVVAVVNVGSDLVTAVKQAHEFGLVAAGQILVAPIVYLSDVHSLGLETAQGMFVTTGFYWDDNDASRRFAERFRHLQGSMPNQTHAGTYAALHDYLASVAATGSTDPATVIHAMKSTPTEFIGKPASIREDGRVVYDLGLYQVKAPGESKGPWDAYRRLRVIPGESAFLPLRQGGCSFIKPP